MDLGDGGQEFGDAGFGEEVFEFGAEEGDLVFEVGEEPAVLGGVFGAGVGAGGTGSAAAEVGAARGAAGGEAGREVGSSARGLAAGLMGRVLYKITFAARVFWEWKDGGTPKRVPPYEGRLCSGNK